MIASERINAIDPGGGLTIASVRINTVDPGGIDDCLWDNCLRGSTLLILGAGSMIASERINT